MKFTIHQSSRYGSRPYNQDRLAYSYSKDSLLLVIADGMGGHRHGEVAAQLAVKSLTDAFQEEAKPLLKNPTKFLNTQIQHIHDSIGSLTLANNLLEAPRTTIVAAILQHGALFCAHVGDSRLYHLRSGKVLYRTQDHSVVQALQSKGLISKQEMLIHPDRNKIYNCLGGDKTPQIDIAQTQNLHEGDILLLCTDGLWSSLSDEMIAETLQEGAISKVVPNLIALAEKLNGEDSDNISAIGMQWGHTSHENNRAVSTATMPLNETTTIINPTIQTTIRNDSDTEPVQDLTDDEIEKAIAEIQAAINKTQA